MALDGVRNLFARLYKRETAENENRKEVKPALL
jgi:hypothetical protein